MPIRKDVVIGAMNSMASIATGDMNKFTTFLLTDGELNLYATALLLRLENPSMVQRGPVCSCGI
jgi:hypothetical protein